MFTTDDVTKIAKLSSLEIDEAEKQVFAEQFSTILDYFKILDTIDVPSETIDRDESKLVIGREDRSEPSPVTPDQFSPYTTNQSFKVPKVIDASN